MAQLTMMRAGVGDFPIKWHMDKPEEIKAARENFEICKKQKCAFFRVSRVDGKPTTQKITEFDPNAEEIMVVPPQAGG